ncbi:replication initiator protein A [Enterococcus pallens]|uniref:Replication initiator A N-terminal domain-containing protein n=1 Tax=Enterococcus pallens ATCC BAA-351 TaxID=1158607 RepID=R2SJQ5_9ENTE|nr:replication initiator protein A [Enterococcus pallens]EOH93106.1 hypothetical protein UAU_02748 [Enterococcus pallens ATCC BAA-351]EOU24892.1 hypothetical protein I588_00879 [Enterococcus pallens ATCC BAA-351]OJG76769.1 hypothetical protein RV10_GL003274 [Enterococcus pallens]
MSTFNAMTATNLPNGNYLPIDLNLINNPKYQDLSIEAMMLHALYTMRMTCSIHNSRQDGSWLDEKQLPYIYFSNDEAAALLKVSERKITTLRNRLAELDLIKVLRHGLKNYRIYVANPEAPAEGTVVKLSFKNYTSNKKMTEPAKVLTVDDTMPKDAKSAAPRTQNLPTSTQKQQVNKNTNTTNATQLGPAAQNYPQVDKESALIAGLQSRYAQLIPHLVFQRFLPFCDGKYAKAKWFVDTIFKAKYVSNQQFLQAGLPAEAEVLTFEENEYYRNGLADAVAKAIEQMYRYNKVRNPEAFFFAFMRGYFTEKTRQYLLDHYELTPELENTLLGVKRVFSKEKFNKNQQNTLKIPINGA